MSNQETWEKEEKQHATNELMYAVGALILTGCLDSLHKAGTFLRSLIEIAKLKMEVENMSKVVQWTAEELDMMNADQLIPCIKKLRERKQLGLAEAKVQVETFMKLHGLGRYKHNPSIRLLEVPHEFYEAVAREAYRIQYDSGAPVPAAMMDKYGHGNKGKDTFQCPLCDRTEETVSGTPNPICYCASGNPSTMKFVKRTV